MKVLLGVCGGIAAYKAAELVRELQARDVEVQVAMTRAAKKFVTPLTFAALTGKPVMTSLWQPSAEGNGENSEHSFEIEHITATQDIDALVIAPATANTLAKLAHGLANDFLSTLYLATTAPVIIAPAMNVLMWQHPATQANIEILKQRGVHIVEPDAGYLACGMTGSGRLADIRAIADAVLNTQQRKHDLSGETILITAGGTREPLDPVRFLGNRSSGKMGHALCEAAIARGAKTVLVTSSPLPAPLGCESIIRVNTADEMTHAVLEHLHAATIVIGAAAVADFRPRAVASTKIRRSGPLTLELEPTTDIIATAAAQRRPETLIIAFAAETENAEANARAKLLRKGADAIIANQVGIEGTGFESDRNAGFFITAEETVALPESSKRVMADGILDQLIPLRRKQQQTQHRISDLTRERPDLINGAKILQ